MMGKKALVCLFCLLPPYWAYLIFSTQPYVVFDAAGYVELGRLILDKGLAEYFRSGVNRELLFPFLISVAMRAELLVHVSYAIILKFILFTFLAFAMWGTYRIGRMMGAGAGLSAIAAFYIGISPSILNSSLWLWSEAAAYPWVIGIVILSIRLWGMIWRGALVWQIAAVAALMGLTFFIFALVKAPAASMLAIFLLPFYVAGFMALIHRDWQRAGRFALACAVALSVMGAAVHGYKLCNLRGNGNYQFTDRGEWAFFGNTVRRLQPVNRDRLMQAFLSVPRLGLCEQVYGRECVFWSYLGSDLIMDRVRQQLSTAGLSSEETSQFYLSSALKFIGQHPFQQAFFMLVEASKMLFWENRLYFVQYPPWLNSLHSHSTVVFVRCFGWALLSLFGLLAALIFLLKSMFSRTFAAEDEAFSSRLLVFWFVGVFAGLYSLFFIDIRYALPIAPLLIMLLFRAVLWKGREKKLN